MKIRFQDESMKRWFKLYCWNHDIRHDAPTERLVGELKDLYERNQELAKTAWGVEQEIKAIHEAYAAQMRPLEEENKQLRAQLESH